MSRLEELRTIAKDPDTPLTTLQHIAQTYPSLRPEVALNPSTYPALLEWLGKLGDPAVDRALRERAAGGAGVKEPEIKIPPLPTTGSNSLPARSESSRSEESADNGATATGVAVGAGAAVGAGEANKSSAPGAASEPSQPSEPESSPAKEDEQSTAKRAIYATYAATAAAGAGAGAAAGASADTPTDGSTPPAAEEKKGKRALPIWLVALLAIVAVLALGGIVFAMGSGAAKESNQAKPSASASSVKPSKQATPKKEAQGTQDAKKITTDGKATPKAEPKKPSKKPDEEKKPEADKDKDKDKDKKTETPKAPDYSAPAGAVTVPQFQSMGNKVSCDAINGAVTCTVIDAGFSTGCEKFPDQSAAQAFITADGTIDFRCVPRTETNFQQVGSGASTVNGKFACTARGNDGMLCWDTQNGRGFYIGTDTWYGFEDLELAK